MFKNHRINIFIILLFVFCLLFTACTKLDDIESKPVPVMDDPTSELEVHYNVFFDAMGGSSVSQQSCTYDSLLTKPNTPTKENYKFLGWYVDKLYSREWDFDRDTVLNSFTLYARWQLKKTLVISGDNYDFNVNDSRKEISFSVENDVSSVSLTQNVLVADDNLFLIYDTSDISNAKPLSEPCVIDIRDLAYGNNTYYLVVTSSDLKTVIDRYKVSIYRKKTYSMLFYGMDNVLLQAEKSVFSENEKIVFPDYHPLGYSVTSWKNENGSVFKITDAVNATADMVFYAQCVPSEYSIDLDANGGSLKSTKAKVTFGVGFELPVPQKEGHIFEGWSTREGVELTGKNGVGNSAWIYYDVDTIYALWTPYSFNFRRTSLLRTTSPSGVVSYEAIPTSGESKEISYGKSVTFIVDRPPVSTTDDYVYFVFCGWYDKNYLLMSGSMSYTVDEVKAESTVYDVWTTIGFHNNCDSVSSVAQSDFSAVVTPDIGSKTFVELTDEEKVDYNRKKTFGTLGETVSFLQNNDTKKYTFVKYSFNEVDYTSSKLTLRTSLNDILVQTYWTEYSLHFHYVQPTSTTDNGWAVSVNDQITEKDQVLSVPISDGKYFVEAAFTMTDVDALTFVGWYDDAECLSPIAYTDRNIDSGSVEYLFEIEKPTSGKVKDVYLKWIARPIRIVSDQNGGAVSVDYKANVCGTPYSIDVTRKQNYYFSGVYSDSLCTEILSDYTIPDTDGVDIFVKQIEKPFNVVSNIAGAGRIDYALVSEVNGRYRMISDKVASEFGKTSVFTDGFFYNDILLLTASTYDNYVWMGWYFSTDEGADKNWSLFDLNNKIEIKLNDKKVFYRATWRAVGTDVSVRIVKEDNSFEVPGSVDYYTYFDDKGVQTLFLNANINYGFIFNGWYIDRINNSVDDVDSDIWEENVLLTKNKTCSFDISSIIDKYDLSSIEARYVALDNTYLKIDGSESGLNYTVSNILESGLIGYYDEDRLIYELKIDLQYHDLIEYPNIGSFNYVKRVGGNESDITYRGSLPELIGREEIITQESIFINYIFDYSLISDNMRASGSEPYYLEVKTSFLADKTGFPDSIDNSDGIPNVTKVKVASFRKDPTVDKNYLILSAIPGNGNVFTGWQIDSQSYDFDPNPSISGAAGKTYKATWSEISSETSKLYFDVNIKEGGSVSVSGNKISNGTQYRLNYIATVNNGYSFLGWFDDNDNLINANKEFFLDYTSIENFVGSNKTVIYIAKFSKISAKINIDSAVEYKLTGYYGSDGFYYYTISPKSDSASGDNFENHNGYCFLGWYENDNSVAPFSYDYSLTYRSDLLPTYLVAKWSKIPSEILPGFESSEILFEYTYSDAGKATYSYFVSEGKINLKLHVNPKNGYIFEGWYADSEYNTLISTDIDYIFELPFRYTIRDNTLYLRFTRLPVNYSWNSIVRQGISGTITDSSVASPYLIVSHGSAGKTDFSIGSGVKSGFVFMNWLIDLNGTERIVLSPEVSFSEYLTDHDQISFTPTYGMLNKPVVNRSTFSGDVLYYGSYYFKNADSNVLIYNFELTPKNGCLFDKIVDSTGKEYRFDETNSIDPDVNWIKKGDRIFVQITDNNNVTDYTVYWKSVWQTIPYYVQVDQFVDHAHTSVTGYYKKINYGSGKSNSVQINRLTTKFDLEDFILLGWYKDIIDEDGVTTVYCDGSNSQNENGDYVFDTEAVAYTMDFSAKWGKYAISIDKVDSKDDDNSLTPVDYSAEIKFILSDSRTDTGTYVTEIGVAYMNDFDPAVFSDIANAGYEYSPIDLNRFEGGKYVVLVWKKEKSSNPDAKFVSKISLIDTTLTYTAKVLFSDERNVSYVGRNADLNIGLFGRSVGLYYSVDASLGKPIESIGIYSDGMNYGFGGEFDFVDHDEKVNITPFTDISVSYVTFKRAQTVVNVSDNNVLVETVSINKALSYPDRFVDIVEVTSNLSDDLIFAGWYDSPDMKNGPYDFSQTVFGNKTLYAKWYTLSDYGFGMSNVLSLNSDRAVSSQTSNGTYCFTALSDATYTLNFRFGNVSQTTIYNVIEINSSKSVLQGQFGNESFQSIAVPVRAGRLYRLNVQSVGTSGTMQINLVGELPVAGGKYSDLIRFNEPLIIRAVPTEEQTFSGWFDESGEEISEVTTEWTGLDENNARHIVYRSHDTAIHFTSEQVNSLTNEIELTAKFDYYRVEIVNPQKEASASLYYTGNTTVGNIITLTAIAADGFKFVEWMIFDTKTGDKYAFEYDKRFSRMIDESNKPSMNVFSFEMIEESLVIIPVWTFDTASDTYLKENFDTYTISYENAYINSPENREVFYVKKTDEKALNTDVFDLSVPTRYEESNSGICYYLFEGWYYHDVNNVEYPLYQYNANDRKYGYYFDPAVAINYSQNSKVSVYAKWSACIPKIEILTDDEGSQYILFGEYPQSLVDINSAEFGNISATQNSDGYYYSKDRNIKYYKYSENEYYRVERVRWDVLSRRDGKIFIQMHDLIFGYYFNLTDNTIDNIFANNWENSSVRSYLNGEFLTVLFNDYEINIIKRETSYVGNTPKDGNLALEDENQFPWIVQNDTEDYLFFLSYNELTDNKYGFSATVNIECDARKAKASDLFKRINGIDSDTYVYWTRSPGNSSYTVYVVDEEGKIVVRNGVSFGNYAIRPCMRIYYELIK